MSVITVPSWLTRLAAIGATAAQQASIQTGYIDSPPNIQAALDTLVGAVDNPTLANMLTSWAQGNQPFAYGFPGGGLPFGSKAALLTGLTSDDTFAISAGTGQKLNVGGGGSGVSSFNTRTGVVTLSKADVTGTGLTYSDVGADASGAAAAAAAASLPLAGGTMTGAIAMGSHKITGLTNGSSAQDAAAFGQIPTALPPNGTAGGSLGGTYPNPSIASSVSLPGSPTTTTQTALDNSTKVATTAYTDAAVAVEVTRAETAEGLLLSKQTITTVAYSATITPAAPSNGSNLLLNIGALTANMTLGAPTGSPIDGQEITLRLSQNATGGWTITFNSAYAFGTDVTTAMVPTAASSNWEMLFRYYSSVSKWRALAIARGF